MIGWINSILSEDKEAEIVLHGAAADTDPELYWNTVITFVGRFIV